MFTTSSKILASMLGLALVAGELQAQVPNPNNPYGIGTNQYTTAIPGFGGINPSNPYATGFSGMGGGMSGIPYWPGYGAPIFGEAGGYLYGASQVLKAQGELMMNEEMARILREKANQAYIETRKGAFDLERYIRDNTPSFTEGQAKIAAERLRRIQDAATSGEIESGQALNLLLKDLGKHRGKSSSIESMMLPEETLSRLNITFGNSGNMGVLRNDGRFSWPLALLDVVPEEQRTKISTQTQEVVNQAASGKVNPNIIKELYSDVKKMREELFTKVNTIPTSQYIQAKRFLTNFNSAIRALETDGFASKYFQFQKFSAGGKTVQELIQFMQKNGLEFAPSTQGDEAAYQALYNALANYDIALNTQVATAPPNKN